jgi:hypothetical protein
MYVGIKKSCCEVGMTSSAVEIRQARAQRVTVSDETLTVDLTDGRTISVPLAWYPRLLHASPVERRNWRLVSEREGVNWPDLDEDISVESLLSGKRSAESQSSLKRWLESRASTPS